MSSNRRANLSVLVLLVVLGLLAEDSSMVAADSSYRKPPFNGSIFGKRSPNMNLNSNSNNNNNDYDNGGKALSAMCEIALDACQSWFPQDKK